MIKTAQIQFSSPISTEEEYQAKKILISIKYAKKSLEKATKHLENVLKPFEDNPDISAEEVWDNRAMFRGFRDTSVYNFNNFKIDAFKCINFFKTFESDYNVIKIVKSFIDSIDDLQKAVNTFTELFDPASMKSKSFVTDIKANIEDILSKSDDIFDLIDNRIKTYVTVNILNINWLDEVRDNLKVKEVERKSLLINN